MEQGGLPREVAAQRPAAAALRAQEVMQARAQVVPPRQKGVREQGRRCGCGWKGRGRWGYGRLHPNLNWHLGWKWCRKLGRGWCRRLRWEWCWHFRSRSDRLCGGRRAARPESGCNGLGAENCFNDLGWAGAGVLPLAKASAIYTAYD